jgi:hypothetical protein
MIIIAQMGLIIKKMISEKSNYKKNNTLHQNIYRANEFKEKIKNGVPLDEVLESYNNHREKYKYESQQRMKGWEDLKYSHHQKYNPNSEFHMNQVFGDKYNIHNSEEVIHDNIYWDSKENDEYWKKSRWERLKLLIKEKVSTKLFVNYYREALFFNFILMILLIYYANKKSKQIII